MRGFNNIFKRQYNVVNLDTLSRICPDGGAITAEISPTVNRLSATDQPCTPPVATIRIANIPKLNQYLLFTISEHLAAKYPGRAEQQYEYQDQKGNTELIFCPEELKVTHYF